MARRHSPLVLLLLVFLSLSPPIESAVTISDILTSAFGSWASKEAEAISRERNGTDVEGQQSNLAVTEIAENPAYDDEENGTEAPSGEGEAPEEGEGADLLQNLQQNLQLSQQYPVHTVYATLTHYIQVTSTKRDIPMCVTTNFPLPPCSLSRHEQNSPFGWWRTARSNTPSEIHKHFEVQEDQETDSEAKMLSNPLERFNPFRNTHLHIHHHINKMKKPKPSIPLFNPLDPNNAAHPFNPAHASNLIALFNGALNGFGGLFGGAIGGGRDGIRVSDGKIAGQTNTHGPRLITEFVTKTDILTKVITEVDKRITATMVAQNCLPDSVPHCKSSYASQYQYDPAAWQHIMGGYTQLSIPRYGSEYAEYVPLSDRSEKEVILARDGSVAPVEPSTSPLAPETPNRKTPPLILESQIKKEKASSDEQMPDVKTENDDENDGFYVEHRGGDLDI